MQRSHWHPDRILLRPVGFDLLLAIYYSLDKMNQNIALFSEVVESGGFLWLPNLVPSPITKSNLGLKRGKP